jgi:hypothetical protein
MQTVFWDTANSDLKAPVRALRITGDPRWPDVVVVCVMVPSTRTASHVGPAGRAKWDLFRHSRTVSRTHFFNRTQEEQYLTTKFFKGEQEAEVSRRLVEI